MGQLIVGTVVAFPFPFSDLSATKRRPAVVLADAGRGDWLLCQVTSKAYTDSEAVTLTSREFLSGSFDTVSYARPAKLFTGSAEVVHRVVGQLRPEVVQQIVTGVIRLVTDGK